MTADPLRSKLAAVDSWADVLALKAALTAVLDKLDDIDLVLRLNDLGTAGKALGVASSDLRFVIADSLGVLPVEDNQ